MAAHRYWGLALYARVFSGDLRVAVAELDFRATVGGADLCAGGTPGASSTDGGYSAGSAFDNDPATFWVRGGVSAPRLWYDFGAPVNVAQAWFRLPASAAAYPGSTCGPLGVQVIGSDNATAWASYASYGTPTVADDAEFTVTLEPLISRLLCATAHLPDRWPAGPLLARGVGATPRHDPHDGGAYRVAGTVAIDGTPTTPVRRRVRLFHRLTGRLIRETWSALDGTFAFEKIALAEYLVVSDDYTRVYNAVVADAVVSVP